MDAAAAAAAAADLQQQAVTTMEVEPAGSPGCTPQAGGRRLMIREMVLDNFKSYAGAQRVGPFHNCFSSVVGPNGSGKSNVIDAMLFVFGRRAKQLRFNKVSELIHNSTNHRDLERACVTVHFQEIVDKDGDDYNVVPNSEFTVARTANRNNTSDYYVNGRRASAKDVAALLKGKGIDLDNNRFLILQGEVEQISLMRPKGEAPGDVGLLEYLEDIIGTDALVPQIEEAAKELEEVTERRGAMVAKLKGAEKELQGLEGRAAEAAAYLGKQRERLQWSVVGRTVEQRAAARELAHNEQQQAAFAERLAHEKAKLADFDAALAAVEAEHAAAQDALAATRAAGDRASGAMKELELRDTKLRMELKHLKAKRAKASAKHAADAAALEALAAGAARWQAELPADAAAQAQLAAQAEQAEAHLEQLQDGTRGEVEALHQQLSKVRAELAPWESKMQEVAARADVAKAERDVLLKEQEAAKARLQAAKDALAAAARVAEEKEEEIGAIGRDADAQRRAADAARQQVEASTQKERALEAQLRGLRGTAAAMRADSSASASQSAVVAALLEAKRRGDIPGVYGRLGDLGAIDAKYDVAVSTACPALNYVVVETTSDAQRCVELLRKRQLGVATFLILEKQRGLAAQMAERVSPPDGAPRLFDLVKVDDAKLRLAFWYAMRNTLVAADLEQATRIAYGSRDKRFARVVTLQGQLIAETGTMSGGGGRARGGLMRLGSAAPRAANAAAAVDAKSAAKELAAADKALAEAEAALRAARGERDAAEKALAAAEAALAKLELAAPKAAQVAAAKREEAADLKARLAELAAAAEVGRDDAARLAELAQQVSSETAEMAKLRAGCAQLQKRAAALQDKIDNAGGEPLRRAKEKLAALQAKRADLEQAAAKKAAQLKASGKQLDKLRRDAAKAQGEQEALQRECEAKLAELDALTAEAGAVVQQQEEAAAALAQREAAAKEAARRRDAKLQEVGVIRNVEVEVEAALDKLRAAVKDIAKRQRELARAAAADLAELEKYAAADDGGGDDGSDDEEGQEEGDEQQQQQQQQQQGQQQAPDAMDEDAQQPPQAAAAAAAASTSSRRAAAKAAKAAAKAAGPWAPPEELLAATDARDAYFKVTVLEEELRVMSPDLEAIAAFRAKRRDYAGRRREYAAATAARDAARARHDGLRKARLDGFMAGFNAISLRLKEMYQMITLGGDAELELVDTLDPFSEGVVFSVRPPRKSWKHIANLSGGEKTLSSLSLVFALHHYKPTPLYVMDEIDAALDFKNVSIVGHYIKERTKNAQFVIISLRNNMFELADRLVGIYKTDNATKTVTINPRAFVVGGGDAAGARDQQQQEQQQQEQQDGGEQQQLAAAPAVRVA